MRNYLLRANASTIQNGADVRAITSLWKSTFILFPSSWKCASHKNSLSQLIYLLFYGFSSQWSEKCSDISAKNFSLGWRCPVPVMRRTRALPLETIAKAKSHPINKRNIRNVPKLRLRLKSLRDNMKIFPQLRKKPQSCQFKSTARSHGAPRP